MATEEIEISQLELADEILADMVTPVETATETKAITLSQLRKWLGSSLPTGFILPAVGRIEDSRFTLLDGKTLSRTGTYEEFCNKVIEQVNAGNWFSCTQSEYDEDLLNYGQCGRFVIETDYVRIPTITRYIGATITLSEIGKTYAESLPNITFGFRQRIVDVGSTGALNQDLTKDGSGNSVDYASGDYGTTTFNASRSSSTYQDGAKVNPEHTKYPYYMVISTTGQTAEVEIDINRVYEDLELKANKDLSNVSQAGKETVVSWGMPDYSAGVSKVWNTDTTAECAGVIIAHDSSQQDARIQAVVNGFSLPFNDIASFGVLTISFSVDKGDVWKVYGGDNNGRNLMFYPFKGVK